MTANDDSKRSAYLLPESAYATVHNQRVHYARSGHGVPIVLVHGSGASLHIFNRVADRLAAQLEVLRLDLPGFGLTGPRPDRDYTIGAYVSLLHAFVCEQIDGPFILAGHSLGGQVAWNYALDHPDRLRGLVLMNATGYPDKAAIPAALRMARNPLLRPIMRRLGSRAATAKSLAAIVGPESSSVDDELVERVHALTSLPGNRGAFVDFANTHQIDRSIEIAGIRTPTLVLRSDLVDGQHFARDIPQSREISLHGVGHLMPAEAPIAVAEAILEFSKEVR